VLSCLLAWSAPALATEAPDIVRFENKGFVRGTITELDPEGEVVIQTLDGRILRYDMSTVSFAGPIAPTQKDAAGPTHEIELQPAEFQNLQFYRFVRRYDYESLCTRPCTIEVPEGSLRLGAALGSGSPVEGPPINIRRPGRIEVDFKNRRGQRIAGAFVGVVGAVTTLGLLTASIATVEQRVTITGVSQTIDDPDEGFLFAALGTAAVAGGTALFLLLREDSVESTFVPAP